LADYLAPFLPVLLDAEARLLDPLAYSKTAMVVIGFLLLIVLLTSKHSAPKSAATERTVLRDPRRRIHWWFVDPDRRPSGDSFSDFGRGRRWRILL
jgi:hypothetical protein